MDDLRERTRAACLDRLRQVRTLLTGLVHADEDRLPTALAELHAVKGECAMAGLRVMSHLAHALETLLIERRKAPTWSVGDVCGGLDVLIALVDEKTADRLSEDPDLSDLLRELRAASADGRLTAPGDSADTVLEQARGASPAQTDGLVRDEQRVPWIRVDGRRIDSLCERIAEVSANLGRLETDLNDVVASAQDGKPARSVQLVLDRFVGARSALGRVVDIAWALRLVPLGPTLQELAEHARKLGSDLGKQLDVVVRAGGVQVEAAALDEIREPLMHIVRNAVDHGIEAPDQRGAKPAVGRIVCTAESHASQVSITVEDDGCGMDVAALRARAIELELLQPALAPTLSDEQVTDFIFAAGFSQRRAASELSGRGIGLSAARRKVEALGGAIHVRTTPGSGSRFDVLLPASISRERVLVLEAGSILWGIPARWVRSAVQESELLEAARTTGILRTADGLVPARSLCAALGLVRQEERIALVTEIGGRRTAWLVERALADLDLLRRPADPVLAATTPIAASGVLPDGRMVLLLRWAEMQREAEHRRDHDAREPAPAVRKPRILVVDDSPVICDIVSEVLGSAGFDVRAESNGVAALERLREWEADLVITDVEMPRMDGLALLERIRHDHALLPVVVLTTRSSPADRRNAALLGANAYIAKSEFQGETLLGVVRRYVDLPP
jgi:two-component system chemotaxis sensor kinase CheA